MRINLIIRRSSIGLSIAPSDFEERVRSRLSEHDVRYTDGRARVVRLLESAGGPRSISELHEISRDDVPLSSLYRTLTVLSDAGVLQRSHGSDGVAMFELAEWLSGHHHHVVCIGCGAVEDVDVGSVAEELLRTLSERAAASKGFQAVGHRIDVEGLCARCAA
jgi:Fe2+ or Zn2+ uptake regulation protein